MPTNETVEHDGKTYTYIEEYASSMPVVVCARYFIDRCRGRGLYCTRMNGTMIYSDETFEQFDKRWKGEREHGRRMRNCHRDKTLDSLLGKIVKITFIDGEEEVGELIWVEKITRETPYKPQMYHCGSWSFYKSHIKSVVPMESEVEE